MRKKFLIVLAVIPFLFGFGVSNVNADSNDYEIKTHVFNITTNNEMSNFSVFNDFLNDYAIYEPFIENSEFIINGVFYIDNILVGKGDLLYNLLLTNGDELEPNTLVFEGIYETTSVMFAIDIENGILLYNAGEFVFNDLNIFRIDLEIEIPPLPPEYVFTKLFDFIFKPLDILFQHIGISDQTISIGFGNIEWFNLEIILVLKLILTILIVWIFTKFIYWFFRNIFNMITGWLK